MVPALPVLDIDIRSYLSTLPLTPETVAIEYLRQVIAVLVGES